MGVGKDSHSRPIRADAPPPARRQRAHADGIKWSDATFIEDQDQWWHGGLTRSVYLYASPTTFLADIRADAGLARPGHGHADLRAMVDLGAFATPGWTVEARLRGHGVDLVETLPVATPSADSSFEWTRADRDLLWRVGAGEPFDATQLARWPALYAQAARPTPDGLASWSTTIPAVLAWSAELPRLYDLRLTLRDPSGEELEATAIRIGFRRVEIVGLDLLVNGQPILIHGVNRHDFHPERGRTVTRDEMRADIVLMKRFGFDAVRTSHYPNDPAFLELTDELGMYVIAEADIESHAFWGTLCDDPRYLAQWVERVARMAQRDKDHPSVIAWSLGNESGYGANHEAAAAWLRRYDPSRPLHYEGAIRFDWASDQRVSDLTCPMYPPIDAIVTHARSGRQRHPLVMCEYSHAMGNSNGTLAEYWEAIESTPGLQGGFVWELRDHGLVQRLPDGSTRWAYGGDFGDTPHDGDFCVDGLTWPDRTPKPAMWEHHAIATPVRLALGGEAGIAHGRIVLENLRWFRDTAWLMVHWSVSATAWSWPAATCRCPPSPGRTDELALPRGDRRGERRSPGDRRTVADAFLPDRGRRALGGCRARGGLAADQDAGDPVRGTAAIAASPACPLGTDGLPSLPLLSVARPSAVARPDRQRRIHAWPPTGPRWRRCAGAPAPERGAAG